MKRNWQKKNEEIKNNQTEYERQKTECDELFNKNLKLKIKLEKRENENAKLIWEHQDKKFQED